MQHYANRPTSRSHDREAYDQGFDDGLFGHVMFTWHRYTGGNPGYNRAWGSYKRGYEAGRAERNGG